MAESPPVKVLLLSGPFEVRGSSFYTLRLAERLAVEGVIAGVVCPHANRVDHERRRQLRITVFPNLMMPVWGRVVLSAVYRSLLADPPDLIHIQSRAMLRIGTWLARRLDRPWVVTIHDHLFPREKLRIDPIYCKCVIAVSSSVRDNLLANTGLRDDQIVAIPGGVEASARYRTFPVLDPAHVPVIGTAGPLEVVKGLPYFLEAARIVCQTHPTAQFLVAGAGPEEYALRRLSRELGVASQVTFIPNMFDFDASLAAMDVFCLPSLQQGLGTVMFEAMAIGKPVIATRVGGVSGVIQDNKNGLLIDPARADQLAERMNELLNDPMKARSIGEAGRQLVRDQYHISRMIAATAGVYRNAMATESTKGSVQRAG